METDAECPDEEALEIKRIEVDFAIPVQLTHDQQRRLMLALDLIVNAPWNQPKGHVHWVSEQGAKPQFSKADARFLGREPDADAPDAGEPTFDPDVFHIGTAVKTSWNEDQVRLRGEYYQRITEDGAIEQSTARVFLSAILSMPHGLSDDVDATLQFINHVMTERVDMERRKWRRHEDAISPSGLGSRCYIVDDGSDAPAFPFFTEDETLAREMFDNLASQGKFKPRMRTFRCFRILRP